MAELWFWVIYFEVSIISDDLVKINLNTVAADR